ncbi:MAG: hypothetical protein HYW77_02395 [Parcubacteria group bacterium]|nr:hypothetical protein [Parcubacteria group bacterium]
MVKKYLIFMYLIFQLFSFPAYAFQTNQDSKQELSQGQEKEVRKLIRDEAQRIFWYNPLILNVNAEELRTREEFRLFVFRDTIENHPLNKGVNSIGYKITHNPDIFSIALADKEDNDFFIKVTFKDQKESGGTTGKSAELQAGERFFTFSFVPFIRPTLSYGEALDIYNQKLRQWEKIEKNVRIIVLCLALGFIDSIIYDSFPEDLIEVVIKEMDFSFKHYNFVGNPQKRREAFFKALTRAYTEFYKEYRSRASEGALDTDFDKLVKKHGSVEKGAKAFVDKYLMQAFSGPR